MFAVKVAVAVMATTTRIDVTTMMAVSVMKATTEATMMMAPTEQQNRSILTKQMSGMKTKQSKS